MKHIILITLIAFTQTCLAQQIDFLSIIKKSPETSKALGIKKLSRTEQATLNNLLNRAYEMGAESKVKPRQKAPARAAPVARAVYITKISKDNDDILQLENGAIVKITRGFLGFVGFRKTAVLYKDGATWKIWIEGKKTFNCNILKVTNNRPSGAGRLISVSEMKGNGEIIKALDGSMFEVGILDKITTTLWLGPFEALLIDGNRLINLEEGDEIIDVKRIK